MCEGKGGMSKLVVTSVIAACVVLNTPGSTAALQGTICGDYTLPQGAEVHQMGGTLDANGNKIIIIEYQAPGAGGVLKIPFDTIAVTCADPRVRAAVLNYQGFARDIIQASCKFVGDLLAGRVQLPPDKAKYYDYKFAEEWYRKTCLGTK